MCCAPCGVYVVDKIREENVELEGYFYNPNIHPYEEYLRRKDTLEKYSKMENFKVHYVDEYLEEKWSNFKGDTTERCEMCYFSRLDNVVKYAKNNGFDAFTTTLLVSPYQKHNYLKTLGYDLAKKYGLYFFYKDFRIGFREGQNKARELGLYRQKFCGCIISYNNSKFTKKERLASK
jgi:predicted adenine nucleotide alpha hydrolase (AANH) superfamily ATPase